MSPIARIVGFSLIAAICTLSGYLAAPDEFTAFDARKAVELLQSSGFSIVDESGEIVDSVEFGE